MPLNKPTDFPVWASTDVTLPVAGTNNKVQPRPILQSQGADQGNFFTAQEANWLFANNNEWVQYLDQEVTHVDNTILHTYDRRNSMLDDESLEAGDLCRTLGYFSQGDGGGSLYEIKTTGSPDGSKVVPLANGLFGHFIYTSNVIRARQFGCRGDGSTNDTSFLQRIIDLPEDESIDLFQDGVVVDLQGLVYSVSNITFQNKTTIKNGTLLQRNDGDNILQHVGGTTKSNGWSFLHVENVIFDGNNIGTGATTNDASSVVEEDITILDTNNGIYINTSSVATNKYDLYFKDCTFQNIYNSNVSIYNDNNFDSTPIMCMEKCRLNSATSSQTDTISMVVFVKPNNSVNSLNFDLIDCRIDVGNAISYSSIHCKTRFYSSSIITRAEENYLFLGSSNLLFKDCNLNLGVGENDSLVFLSALAYNIHIDSCNIESTFDAIHVRANNNQCSSCKLEINNSDIYTQLRVDRINNNIGTRIGCKVYLNNTRFYKGSAIDTDDTLPNATPSTNTNLDRQDWDEVTISGCTFGMYEPFIDDDFQTGCIVTLRQDYTEFVMTGNIVWVKGSDIEGWSSGMMYLGDNNPMVASITGNTFKNIVGSGTLGNVLSAGFGSLDVQHHVGLAGNLVEGFNFLMGSTVDGTNIPINYNS